MPESHFPKEFSRRSVEKNEDFDFIKFRNFFQAGKSSSAAFVHQRTEEEYCDADGRSQFASKIHEIEIVEKG